MAIAKIDSVIAKASVQRTLDSLYMARDGEGATPLVGEELEGTIKSIEGFEAILEKIKNSTTLTTDDYILLRLSMEVNCALLDKKAKELAAGAQGLKEEAKKIESYLGYLAKTPVEEVTE